MLVLLLSAMIASAAQPDELPGLDPGAAFGIDEADALFRIIRARAVEGSETDLPDQVPDPLNESLNLPLIVTLFQDGLSRFHYVSTQPTLRGCAEEIGAEMKEFFARSPIGMTLSKEGRITLDIVTGAKRLDTMNRAVLSQQLAPGVDGLQCVSERRSDYFTPLTVLRNTRDLDTVKKMYISQASILPPERFAAAIMRTLAFVEAAPGGRALRLYRGNTPVASAHPYDMIEAMSRAGMWLLHAQRADGSFPPAYHPADETTAETGQDLFDHMRTAMALQSLHTLLGEEALLDASDRATVFARTALREQRSHNMAFLPDEQDPIGASALLLNVLCRKAIAEPKPTVTGPMRYLAEFLCVMVDEEGRLYSSVAKAITKSPPYVVKGDPYAETLIALTLYQRVLAQSDTSGGKTALASHRLAARLSELPATLPNTMLDTHVWPRTIEALVRYSDLSSDTKCAEAALKLGARLAKQQIAPGAGRYADYEGGFTERDLPPSTAFTSAALCALVYVNGLQRRMNLPADETAARVRRAAKFLMNMQYREQNTFFLRNPSSMLGAFRRMPQDLSIYPVDVALATRALMLAASVTAETAAAKAHP